MVILDDIKRQLGELAPVVTDLADALAIHQCRMRLDELENKSADPAFYNDPSASGAVFAEMGEIKDKLEDYAKLQGLLSDAQTLLEMCEEDDDPALAEELGESVEVLAEKVEEMRLVTLLTGEYDHNNAILTFHAGAGGTEAQDWSEMLYRMYSRFAARHGFTVKVLDYLDGDEAGLKSASILIEGHNAYGFLRSENGVHRLVRISPFDSSGRRHTSFASLEVMPELDDKIVIEINPADIKMEVYRASGAGGQHINKTSSAVRLIHTPTGIVVNCQNERSQLQNREMCMKMLAAKLHQIKEREHLDKIGDIKGVQNAIAWGSQIRSYVFMPYTLVKDHRTNFENGNVSAVMDGDLDGFINAYLKAAGKGELALQQQ
ncbi:MAG: peptide chain release factor 2 [Ruthenibacterium sp.]